MIINRTQAGIPFISSETLAKWANKPHNVLARSLIHQGFLGLNGGAWIVLEKHRGQTARVVHMTCEAGVILLSRLRGDHQRVIAKMKHAFEEEAARYAKKAQAEAVPPAQPEREPLDLFNDKPQVADNSKAGGPTLVTVRQGQPTTTTLEIAAGTGVQHKNVLEMVRTYKADLEKFGGVAFETRPFETAGGTQRQEIAILNERQATLLISYQRNTDVVRAFKIRLVEEFYRMAEELRGKAKPKAKAEAVPPLTELPLTFRHTAEALLAITGISRPQAILAADRFAATIHGKSFLRMAGIAESFRAECQEPLLTPTEIGKVFQMTPRAVNLLLEKLGLQYLHRIGDDKQWALTTHGMDLGGEVQVVNVDGKKTTVTQIKWARSILSYIEDQMAGVPV